jgi:hypothetical protein
MDLMMKDVDHKRVSVRVPILLFIKIKYVIKDFN